MAASNRDGFSRLAAAAWFVGAAGLFCAVAAGVRPPASPGGAERVESEEVRLGVAPPALLVLSAGHVPVEGGLREQFWLLNPSPLFLPGGSVADAEGARGLDDGVLLHEGGDVAAEFPPALSLPERRPAGVVLRPVAPSSAAVASAELVAPRWFDGLARTGDMAGAESRPVARTARFEIYREDDGRLMARLDLVSDPGFPAGEWAPLTLAVVIDPAGALSRPVMVVSSGDAGVDERVRTRLAPEVLLKNDLRAGTYRLEVGP